MHSPDRRPRHWLRATFLAAGLGLVGCNDGGSSGNTALEPFAENLIRNRTNETGEPAVIENRTFVFREDETAFDDLLPPDDGPAVQ